MSKEDQLAEVAEMIRKDGVCAELAKTATQLVPGAGSADADIVIVGEAPGEKEDQQGLPFVGAAGKFLNEMLADIGLTREDVFVTNIVKYRPPANRDPLPDEVAAFMPYLLEQIEIIQPKLVVTLGRYSMNVFLPGLRISEVHGQPKRKDGLIILPLYHPAAALYNGSTRQIHLGDFRKIPKILSLIEQERTKNG